MISPSSFLEAMRAKWAEYGNVGSPALDQVWLQIADTFNRQTTMPSAPRPVIPAELGAGKTTCAKLYCSMLPSNESHPGVLIVVRTIEQAEEFARDINAWSGSSSAFAYHSRLKKRPELWQLRHHPVLVICHQNYELALEKALVEELEKYEQLMEFRLRKPQRGLVIIDEALDQVYVASVSLDSLRRLSSLIPASVLSQHLEAARILNEAALALLAAPEGSHVIDAETLLARTGLTVEAANAALLALWKDARASRRISTEPRQRVKEALTALRRHLAAYRWTENAHQERTIVGSRLLLPPDAGQVHLDATGRLNNVYTSQGDSYRFVPLTPVRDYSNVILHVARTDGTGKWAMKKRGEKIATETRDAVLAHYGDRAAERRVLVVTTKDSEPLVREIWSAGGFAALDVAHWNAIDGRNDWREFDTLVTLTLPFIKPWQDLAVTLAVKGLEPDDLSAVPEEVREVRETRIAAEIAQAIGRIRLRRMIDPSGACEPCEVFLRVSHNFGVTINGDHVIDGVRRALPGAVVKDWTAVSSPRSADGRPGRVGAKVADDLLALARSMAAGDRIPLTRARFPQAMFYVVLAQAQREGHSLQARLAALRVHIEPGGHRLGTSGRHPAELVRS